jgi:hypothetical protein
MESVEKPRVAVAGAPLKPIRNEKCNLIVTGSDDKLSEAFNT